MGDVFTPQRTRITVERFEKMVEAGVITPHDRIELIEAEKRMLGGLAFLLNGNMRCGVHGPESIARLDADRTELALAQPHTRMFDLSGRPIRGWILVGPNATAADDTLAKWLGIAVDYAQRMPRK